MMLVSNKYDAYATDFFELLFMSVSVFLLKTITLAESIHSASGSLCRVPNSRAIGNEVVEAAPTLTADGWQGRSQR